MTDPIIAYADEYPWARCPCGYILYLGPGTCDGCGRTKTGISYRDRFGASRPGADRTLELYGYHYQPVPFEDAYR